jgi:hypothetical protein
VCGAGGKGWGKPIQNGAHAGVLQFKRIQLNSAIVAPLAKKWFLLGSFPFENEQNDTAQSSLSPNWLNDD